MARRAQPCDVCGGHRLRWQRLCGTCFAALPHALRTGLIAAHKQHRMADWRDFRRRAIAAIAAPARTTIPPERAYALAAAITGERDL